MTIGGIGSRSSLSTFSLVEMRRQLDELQRQLATGTKSDTYAGLGLGRGLSVALRSQLDATTSFDNTIVNVGTRLSIAQQSLAQIAKSASLVRSMAVNSPFTIDGGGQTIDQKTATGQLNQLLDVLNTQAGDRYIFSGQSPDRPSVDSMDHILNGDGVRAGFKTVLAQRNAADLGANGLGRLTIAIPPLVPNSVELAEDAAGSPFGFKLAAISSTLTGATVTGPAGAPPKTTVTLGAANPNAGDTVTYTFNLPDGTRETLTLTATSSSPPGENEFALGATPDATAVNLQTALGAGIGALARTSLAAASAIAASNDFFNVDASHPPQRVGGPPYNTATSLVAGAATTVLWYTGEAGTTPARATATARIDPALSVSYGMRANEQAITNAVANVAVLAAVTFAPADADASARYAALMQRVGGNLGEPPGVQKVSDIEAEVAAAQNAAAGAKDRHAQSANTLTDMLQQIENVAPEEVGAALLALQTRMQASMQTTALLYQTSLVNYL